MNIFKVVKGAAKVIVGGTISVVAGGDVAEVIMDGVKDAVEGLGE